MATLLLGTTVGGYAAIHAGNIGSQSVNYASTSGSTTGSAGSVVGLTLTSSANGINPDNVTQNQLGYNTSVSLFGQTDGGLYSSAYSSAWIHQIYGDFRTGQIALRGKNNGVWQSWRRVLDESNFTTWAATAAQGTKADSAYGWGNHASAGYATTTYVNTQIANLVASAPAALDTLNELAAALGNDASFSTTVSTALGNRLRVDTAAQGLNGTQQSNARTNLGLGTAATANTGDFATASHTHTFASLTSKPTTISGYGITDAITTGNIASQSVNYATSSGSTTGNAGSATVLQTARTITIGNTGKTFNGSADISWSLAEIGAQAAGSYAAASHTHDDRYYTETESDARFLRYYGVNQETDFQRFQDGVGEVRFDQINDYNNLSNAPGGYNYGGVLSMRGDNFGFQIWGSHTGDLYYKTQWSGDNYTGWRSIITSINIGSQSVNYANSAGSVAWTNVSGRPTTVSSFTNDSGYITSASLSSYVPTSRTITINGTSYDLSANRSWTISATDNTKLPLAGGTMTGVITTVSSGTAINFSGQSDSFGYNATAGLGTYIKGTSNTYIYGGGVYYDGSTSRTIWHSGNLTNLNQLSNGPGYITSSASISGNAATATYATNTTRLYASDGTYVYGGANPYYLYMNYDGGSYWELKVSPATPGTVRVAYANSAGSAGSASTSSQVTINYNNDSNSTYQLLWGSGNSVYGTSQVYVNPYSDVIYARGGYISPGNPWGTADSAYFPNGITTAGSDNWIYGHTYIGNAPANGNGHEFWADGNMRSTRHHYLDANYGQTIVGRYSSTVYQGVWAMGDSYKLPIDGSSTGSLYGLAWSHPNAGGVASNLNTHGLLVMENGTFLAAISGSIRARDDVRAPAIYDSGSRVAISRGEGRNYVDYSRYVYNNGAYSGSGWIEPSDLGVRYAGTAGYCSGRAELLSAMGGCYNDTHPGYGARVFYDWNNCGAYRNGISIGSHPGDTYYGWQIYQNMWDDRTYTRRYNGGWQGTRTLMTLQDDPYPANMNQYVRTSDSVTFTNIYNNGWFRNNNNLEGLYNQSNGNHFYSNGGGSWGITGNGGNVELQFRSNHQSTLRGYVYGDTSSNFGLLNDQGGWSVRCYSGAGYGGYLSGTWTASGDLVAYSDSRVKENVETIENPVEKVLLMRGVTYNRTDIEDKSRKVGVIAQEIQAILPEVVTEQQDGMLGVSYGNIVGVLIEAIKEQQKEIEILKSKLN